MIWRENASRQLMMNVRPWTAYTPADALEIMYIRHLCAFVIPLINENKKSRIATAERFCEWTLRSIRGMVHIWTVVFKLLSQKPFIVKVSLHGGDTAQCVGFNCTHTHTHTFDIYYIRYPSISNIFMLAADGLIKRIKRNSLPLDQCVVMKNIRVRRVQILICNIRVQSEIWFFHSIFIIILFLLLFNFLLRLFFYDIFVAVTIFYWK